MYKRNYATTWSLLAIAAGTVSFPLMAFGDPIFSDDFNTSASAANYNVFQTTGASNVNTGSVAFAWDYSALGIPSAPNSLGDGSTLGLRVQSDESNATSASFIIGAINVATKSVVLPAQYKMSVEVWANYVGDATGIPGTGGSNSSTGATFGVSTAGTAVNYAVNNTTPGSGGQGGVLFDAIRDATSSGGTYRLYINGTNEGNNAASPPVFPNNFYAAGTDSTAAQFNTADSGGYYKTLFPSVTAPTVQSSAASTQGNATPAGVFGFAWHNVTVTQDGTNVTWAVDGTTISTVPDSSFTSGGSAITLGDQDSNTSTGPALYNFEVYDDLVVTATPEPGSLALLGIAGAGLLARRRRA